MGDHAEMILNGILCESCGAFIDQIPKGYPCYCPDCIDEEDEYPDDFKMEEPSKHYLHAMGLQIHEIMRGFMLLDDPRLYKRTEAQENAYREIIKHLDLALEELGNLYVEE